MRGKTLLKLAKIREFCMESMRNRGYPPTQLEMAKKFKISQTTVRYYIKLMEKLKLAKRRKGLKKSLARAIKLTG